MEKERIEKEIKELESKIGYKFKDISRLKDAMRSVKIEGFGDGKNAKEYSNEALATVGDAILKCVLTDILFDQECIRTKGEITERRSNLENNEAMHRMMLGEGLIDYSYNELHFYKDPYIPKHEKVVCKKHDPYVEAIVGAVFYDSDYDTTKRWIMEWLMPLLKKYKKDNAQSTR